MAAGSNLYSREKDTIQQDGALYDLFYAKELSAYGSVDNVKALFYLDYVFQSVVAGENVFVGGVRENSNNYYFHKNTRMSMFGLHADGVNYILLNDAGLNTFAQVFIKEILANWANFVQVKIGVYSAYYSPTTQAGVRGTVVGNGNQYTAETMEILPSQGVKDYVLTVNPSAVKNNIFNITPFGINEEGEKRDDTVQITLDDSVIQFNVRKVNSTSQEPSKGTVVGMFMFLAQYNAIESTLTSADKETGLYAFKDVYLNKKNNFSENGYYVLSSKFGFVVSGGQLVSKFIPASESTLTLQVYINVYFNAPDNGNDYESWENRINRIEVRAVIGEPQGQITVSGSLYFTDHSGNAVGGGRIDDSIFYLTIPSGQTTSDTHITSGELSQEDINMSGIRALTADVDSSFKPFKVNPASV